MSSSPLHFERVFLSLQQVDPVERCFSVGFAQSPWDKINLGGQSGTERLSTECQKYIPCKVHCVSNELNELLKYQNGASLGEVSFVGGKDSGE